MILIARWIRESVYDSESRHSDLVDGNYKNIMELHERQAAQLERVVGCHGEEISPSISNLSPSSPNTFNPLSVSLAFTSTTATSSKTHKTTQKTNKKKKNQYSTFSIQLHYQCSPFLTSSLLFDFSTTPSSSFFLHTMENSGRPQQLRNSALYHKCL